MKKNSIILISIFLLSISCSQEKEKITPITIIQPLRQDTVYKIPDRGFVDILILDSLLIFIANKDSNYFHIYNKVSMEPIIQFGKKGNAEFEFNSTPLFVKQYYENSIFFEVFDLFSMRKINIKNIINGSNISEEIKANRMDEELFLSRNIAVLDSNLYARTSLNVSKGLFHIYDKKNKHKKWIDYNPKLKIHKKYYDSVYYGLIEVSPDNETIVYCPRFFDRILFFNRKGELQNTLNFSKIKAPKVEREYLGVSNEEIIYSFQSFRTENYIYILRPIKSLTDIELAENILPVKAQVLCLTWDGDISAAYELDFNVMPTLFCVDEENKKIIFNTPLDNHLSKDIINEISVFNLI